MGNCAHDEEGFGSGVTVENSDNPFDFYTETAPAFEAASADEVTEAIEEKEEEPIQTTIFKDDEIEKVEVVKKKKERKNPLKVTWTKFIEKADDLYKSLNEDIDNENV